MSRKNGDTSQTVKSVSSIVKWYLRDRPIIWPSMQTRSLSKTET